MNIVIYFASVHIYFIYYIKKNDYKKIINYITTRQVPDRQQYQYNANCISKALPCIRLCKHQSGIFKMSIKYFDWGGGDNINFTKIG